MQSLGVRNGQWQPNAVARSALDSMVVPLTLYVKPSETDTRTREDREVRENSEYGQKQRNKPYALEMLRIRQ